jgi:hypothetical protein
MEEPRTAFNSRDGRCKLEIAERRLDERSQEMPGDKRFAAWALSPLDRPSPLLQARCHDELQKRPEKPVPNASKAHEAH